MKFIKTIFFLLLFLGLQTLHATEFVTLPDIVGKPRKFRAYGDRLFIAERYTVHTFSLPNLKYLSSFGRRGEGPGEFRRIKGIYAGNKQLHFASTAEINVFTLEGEFVNRVRTNKFIPMFFSFDKKYVGRHTTRESGKRYVTFSLFDGNLENPKELYRDISFIQKHNKVPYLFPEEEVVSLEDRLYISTQEGKILCFNSDGKKIKTINPGIKPVPITEEFTDAYLRSFRNSRGGKMLIQMHGARLYMASHFPHIFSFFTDEGKLLVETFESKNGYSKIIVLDRDGKVTATKGALWMAKYRIPRSRIYTYYKNKLFRLWENFEKETWEVHISPLVDWDKIK